MNYQYNIEKVKKGNNYHFRLNIWDVLFKIEMNTIRRKENKNWII